MRALLDLEQTISTRFGGVHYKLYQSRFSTPMWGFAWPYRGYLSVWPHNEDVVSTWGVFVMSNIGYGRKFLVLYMYRLLLTLYTCFKAMRAYLGPKWTILTWLGAGRYKWYQSRSLIPVWRFVWPCRGCFSIRPHNSMEHNDDVMSVWEGVYDASHQIREKVSNAIYVETPFNLIDLF